MHCFSRIGRNLYCERVSLRTLAERFGTPLYVYSQSTLEHHYQSLDAALRPLDHLVCYAVKANSNLAVLRTFADLGAGFDIVSHGELRRVLAAGGDPAKCVFAGVGKTEEEIEFALRNGIYCFNVESEAELERINRIAARLRKAAPVAIRVNPNVEAHTHAKITTGTYENKFGIALDRVLGVYDKAARLRHIRIRGVQMHIGSQITSEKPFVNAVKRMLPLAQVLKDRHKIEFFSVGGGIGIVYDPALESGKPQWWLTKQAKGVITADSYARALLPLLQPLGLRILLEPGRFLVGNAGVLITRVQYIKQTDNKRFVIVDAAMNDLIRPAFYDAYHEIVPLSWRPGSWFPADVVGPVCESGDYFAKQRPLPPVKEGDYLALMSAGAYGSVMASNYNSRPFPPEIMVKGRSSSVVRDRQPIQELWQHEHTAAWQKD
ncbi:MAG: diaminopimelate decarboxylase [Verrucomicrobia bacterium]|nr:diaminopimelate decarboxylase [Verrucomicrobiota bacterium]